MKSAARWLAVGLAVAWLGGGAGAEEKRAKGTFQAERAGWMFGMFVGEEKGQPYPFVVQVDPNGEAKRRGIRKGDELLRFQEEPIQDLPRFFEQVNRLSPGRQVTFWIRRGVQTLRFELRVPKDLGAKPEDTAKAAKAKEESKGDEAKDPADEAKKKPKKKPPIVIKPIPSDQ
jgi:hypothetical protein